MACLLTSGRSLGCKSSQGGLRNIYFADYGTLGEVTIVEGEITVLAGTPEWFKYEIKGNSSLESTINSSRENGTTFYTQTLNVTLPILDKATQEEIKILSVSRPHVAIEDYNGNFFLDLSGFTLTLEGQETAPAYFVLPTVITTGVSALEIDPNA